MNIFRAINSYIQKQSRTVRYGVPFMIFMVCGSFGLKEFAQLRYTFRKQRLIDPEKAKELGIEMKEPGTVTLESEYEKIKDLDIYNWENKRGPRPWEENNQ